MLFRSEINVLGLSTLRQTEGKAIVYAQLAILASLKPSDGVLKVEARLTPNSWILDPGCRLTGGFAFYTWFAGPHAGDFVVCLGGYHPAFKIPDHYPTVPRLGFNWPLGSVTVKGETYFALTPSCVMAGGRLEVTYQSGDARAWLTATTDFLISWEPFHYDIQVAVSIGASYKTHGIIEVAFQTELSAQVHIWGPSLRGEVRLDWSVISFTDRKSVV